MSDKEKTTEEIVREILSCNCHKPWNVGGVCMMCGMGINIQIKSNENETKGKGKSSKDS